MKKKLEKRERGRIKVLPNFWGPLLSQEREKLRISNLVSRLHLQGPSEQKPIKKLEKREHGCIQGLPNFFGYPLLSQERGKLLISNLATG